MTDPHDPSQSSEPFPPASSPPFPPAPGARPPVDFGPARARPPQGPGNPGGWYPPPYGPVPPSRRRSIVPIILLILVSLLLVGSVLLNVALVAVNVVSASATASEPLVESTYAEGDSSHRIVILPVHGVIADEAAQFVHQAVRSLAHNKPAAVVLRVDSPGGSVSASDRIWNDLKSFRKESGVPIVASYGGVAASGGYYISCGSDSIVAEPTTITGSIGVIAEGFTLERLLDKIGVTPEVQHSDRAEMKDSLSPMRKWEPRDHELLARILNTAHERFVNVVAEGRKAHLTLAQIQDKKLDSGAPFTTAEALKAQLIDQEGYLSDAIDKAAALGGVPVGTAPQVTIIGRQPSLLAKLMNARQDGIDPRALGSQQVRQLMDDLATPEVEYRWYPWH